MDTRAPIAYSGRSLLRPRYYANDHSRDVLDTTLIEMEVTDARAHAQAHRWCWFPDMHRDEALVFKTHDSDRSRAHCVPHVAFDHSACPAHAAPRASIEMRALALWFA